MEPVGLMPSIQRFLVSLCALILVISILIVVHWAHQKNLEKFTKIVVGDFIWRLLPL